MDLERARGNQYRATRVCVDSYDNGVPVGRFYNPGMAETAVFHSMSQFLLRMEELLDRMGFPTPFAASRTFASAPPDGNAAARGEGEALLCRGKNGTIALIKG